MIYFISFASTICKNSLVRIKQQAINSNFFDEVRVMDELSLEPEILKYCTDNQRGFGYWIWKPILIKKTLLDIDYNDIIVYADAGCTINSNAVSRFQEYVDLLN